jgi:dimethylargininase
MIAITRPVSDALAACELSFVERTPIDIDLARAQHAAYEVALRAMGCEVVQAPAAHAMADAVFVEDTAVVVDEIAVMTRTGAESRRDEGVAIEPLLAQHRPVARIVAPGTLDGGDVLRLGLDVYVGRAARSNDDGIAQLRAILVPFGYRVHAVRTRDCLHLKSAVTAVADGIVLINRDWLQDDPFGGHRCIEVDPDEPHAANAVRVGASVLHPASFPRTRQRLREAGIGVRTVDLSELQKAEGAATCCSILL